MRGTLDSWIKPQPNAALTNSKKRKLQTEETESENQVKKIKIDSVPVINQENKENNTNTMNHEKEKEEEQNTIDKDKDKDKDKNKVTEEDKKTSENEDENESESNNESDNESETEEKGEEIAEIEPIKFENAHLSLDASWKQVLKNEFVKPYFIDLCRRLGREEKKGAIIYPPINQVYSAFNLCPWDQLKVVILGQDPYHDTDQAEGLCFSVRKGIAIPPSLRNIYKEASTDVGFKNPGHGSLVHWGTQGVLLLNAVLTVGAHQANSHKDFGWQQFTDSVIKIISDQHDGIVFILWGAQAQKKISIINKSKHRIVKSAHPSGLSAHKGFLGSKPFSQTNAFLKELGKSPVDWQIPS